MSARRLVCLTLCLATVGAGQSLSFGASQSASEFYNDMEFRRQRDRAEQMLVDLRKAGQELEVLTQRIARRFDAVPDGRHLQLSGQDLEDFKRVEKLAKRVRELHGARGDGEDTQPLPADFTARIALLARLGVEVRQAAEKTSRHTLSVGLLSRTTRILRLSRSLRSECSRSE